MLKSHGEDHWGMGEDYKRQMLLWMVFFKLGLSGQDYGLFSGYE